MEIAVIALLAALIIITLIILIRSLAFDRYKLEKSIADSTRDSVKLLGDIMTRNQAGIGRLQSEKLSELNTSLSRMQHSVEYQLETIRKTNKRELDEMRGVVDEKLAKSIDTRISESFKIINDRLEQVYKGLGEMQTLASGVGDLKKVLSNVKTRGILGELQLGNILEEILAPEQYGENVMPDPSSRNVVEFAIKLPGTGDAPVYLPIDAKFPATLYHNLQDAYEEGDISKTETCVKELIRRIKSEAADISEKYIHPPYTTDFAVMFLPVEGLYAEAVNRGMVEELQNKYRVSLAGPSTMAAMLNALQMGFKTLAIQRQSSEVWNVLNSVGDEFDKFGAVLEATQKKLTQANDDLDKLIGTRTNAIRRKLRAMEKTDGLNF